MQNILIENICQVFCRSKSVQGERVANVGLSDQLVT
jgi:hypothetical protein